MGTCKRILGENKRLYHNHGRSEDVKNQQQKEDKSVSENEENCKTNTNSDKNGNAVSIKQVENKTAEAESTAPDESVELCSRAAEREAGVVEGEEVKNEHTDTECVVSRISPDQITDEDASEKSVGGSDAVIAEGDKPDNAVDTVSTNEDTAAPCDKAEGEKSIAVDTVSTNEETAAPCDKDVEAKQDP